MEKFLMICYVAADFVSKNGDKFSITPKDLGNFIEAPVWIKDTVMFGWLVSDGAIKVAETTQEKKKLENDPKEGISAEGKAQEITEAAEEAIAAEATEEVTEEAAEKPAKEAPKAEKEEKTTKNKTTKAKKGESK